MPEKFELEYTKEYLAYLQSEGWQKKRQEKLNLTPYCTHCNDICYKRDGTPVVMCKGPLHVHHKTYARLGNERMSDLEVLCEFHHTELHRDRERDRERRRANAAMDTYATKKYGEGWENWADLEAVSDEFDNWVERQQR